MKKSDVTQELVNIFPSWSKIRTDEQSVGQQALNPIAVSMEKMERELRLMRDNQYLTTANLDEIDLVHKVKLDTDFEWDVDNTDPLAPCPITPEVSGLVEGVWHDVERAETNDIESFWYDSVPNRVTLETTISGEDHELLTLDAGDAPQSGIWEHHLDGGRVWVETTGGVEYLTFEQDKLYRGKVVLHGKTRKGTWEDETIIFPWDMKQPSTKEWKLLTEVRAFDIEDEVEIDVKSADFSGGPYLSQWNLRYSSNRNKIDEFWDLGHNGTIPTLDRIEYQSDEWQQLVLGFSSKDIRDSWELLDETANDSNVVSGVNMTVSGVDIALQPYSERVWVTTGDALYLYDLSEDMVEGVDELTDVTPGAHIQLETEAVRVLPGEPIEFVPWHARPLKEILKYRLWYQRPDGQKFGLLDGTSVSFSSDFWVTIPDGTALTRTVENYVAIPTTQRGEYLVVFEAEFLDGETQNVRKIFTTRYKMPLAHFDLSSLVPGTIDGIDFDSDQKLWVKSGNDYYQIEPHTDIMLVDYTNKVIYFKEDYEEVGIETNG